MLEEIPFPFADQCKVESLDVLKAQTTFFFAHWWVVNGDLISVQSSVAYIHSLIVINNPESRCRFWKELTVSSLLFAPPLVCPSWRHLRQAFSFKSSSKVRTHARRLSLSLSLYSSGLLFPQKISPCFAWILRDVLIALSSQIFAKTPSTASLPVWSMKPTFLNGVSP